MRFSRFGKKIFPDPSAPRTGFLPRMTGKAEIGNKTMLRGVDALLQMESTAGTPSLLQSTEVVPVIDINLAGRSRPTVTYLETANAIAGADTWVFAAYTPPENTFAQVLAADMQITFAPAIGTGFQMEMLWELANDVPNGADRRVPVGGYLRSFGQGTEAVLTQYRAPLGAACVGGSASTPWSSNLGRVYGTGFYPGNALILIASVALLTSANVLTNFPAGTTLTTKVWTLQYPEGQRPLDE